MIIVRSSKHVPAHHHNHLPLNNIVRPIYYNSAPSHHHAKPLPVHHQHGKTEKGGGLEWDHVDLKNDGYGDKQLVKERVIIEEEHKVHKAPVHVLVKAPPPKVKKHVKVIVREHHHDHQDCGTKWLKNLQKSLKKSQKHNNAYHFQPYYPKHKGPRHHSQYFLVHQPKRLHKKSPIVFFYTQTPYYYFTQPPRRYYNNHYHGYGNDYGKY